MLKNVQYNLGREYEFYAIILPGQRKGHNSYKKRNSTQKTKHKNGPSGGGSGSLHDRERRKDNMLNISNPNRLSDRGRHERSPGAVPSTYDAAGRFQHTQSTVGK